MKNSNTLGTLALIILGIAVPLSAFSESCEEHLEIQRVVYKCKNSGSDADEKATLELTLTGDEAFLKPLVPEERYAQTGKFGWLNEPGSPVWPQQIGSGFYALYYRSFDTGCTLEIKKELVRRQKIGTFGIKCTGGSKWGTSYTCKRQR